MKKIAPERLNGLQFIRLSSLPFNQMVRLRDWLGVDDIFSISYQNGTIRNCVKYEGYEFWFDVMNCENQIEELSFF